MLIEASPERWAPSVDMRFYREAGGISSYEALDKRGQLHAMREPSPCSLTAHFAERLVNALTSYCGAPLLKPLYFMAGRRDEPVLERPDRSAADPDRGQPSG
jgi:hypothetical protein